jgi:hypothetical protein
MAFIGFLIATLISATALLMAFARTPPEDASVTLRKWHVALTPQLRRPIIRATLLLLFGSSAFGLGWQFGGKSVEPPASKFATSVYGFWQFSDSTTVPVEKKNTNIRNWYALYTESIKVTLQDADRKPTGEGFSVPSRWTILLLFKEDTKVRQMVADCKGPNAPHCQVQTINEKFAILTILGDVTLSTLEISTTE